MEPVRDLFTFNHHLIQLSKPNLKFYSRVHFLTILRVDVIIVDGFSSLIANIVAFGADLTLTHT